MLTPAGNIVQPVGFDPSGKIVPLQVTAQGYLRVSAQALTEDVQDIIGAMVSGNVETGISVTYDDTNGKLDFVITDRGITFQSGSALAYRGQALQNTPFTATINGAPSGANVTYNVPSAGNASDLAQYDGAAAQTGNNLTAVVLRNTTRGNEALVANVNLATKVITLTANAPANWANGDTITTDAGQGLNFRAVELKGTGDVPASATAILLAILITDTAGSISVFLQEYAAFSSPKTFIIGQNSAANVNLSGVVALRLTSRRVMFVPRTPAAATATVEMRLVGYQ